MIIRTTAIQVENKYVRFYSRFYDPFRTETQENKPSPRNESEAKRNTKTERTLEADELLIEVVAALWTAEPDASVPVFPPTPDAAEFVCTASFPEFVEVTRSLSVGQGVKFVRGVAMMPSKASAMTTLLVVESAVAATKVDPPVESKLVTSINSPGLRLDQHSAPLPGRWGFVSSSGRVTRKPLCRVRVPGQ